MKNLRRWFRRGPWETTATLLIGTIGFVIVSHFPEQ